MKLLFTILRVVLIIAYAAVLFMVWGFGPITALWLRVGLSLVGFVLLYPEIRRIFKINSVTRAAVVLGLMLVLITVWHFVVVRGFYQKIFESYLATPVPSSVKLIEGDEGRWLDAETYLVFQSDAATFRELTKDYVEVSANGISERLSGLTKYIRENVLQKTNIKYFQKIIEGSTKPDRKGKVWHYKKEYFLLKDEESNRVYFYRPYIMHK